MKYVIYYRVSTNKQSLGIEAQKTAVANHLKQYGGEAIASFEEIETGTSKMERPILKEAIKVAKHNQATLLIAKLDRLSRSLAFVANLMESGVKFVAADQVNVNTFTLHVMVAFGEFEAKLISERTKLALAEKRKQGIPLGTQNPNTLAAIKEAQGWVQATESSAKVRQQLADQHVESIKETLVKMKDEGKTLAEIATTLNTMGYKTRRGAKYTTSSVYHAILRI
jgi:DNA invertase Pin-like site-specific DNA recombinase